MTTREKPARSWEIHDLHALGVKGGKPTHYLKAIPVIILERWVKGGRREGIDNIVRTDYLERRIVKSGLHPTFKAKGTSNLLASLSHIQESRNLTNPSLLKPHGEGEKEFNLKHYETLLQEYREEYRERCPEDYKKLFPDEEPEWELPIPQNVQVKRRASLPMISGSEMPSDIQSLFTASEQALRDQQLAVQRLLDENQKLKASLEARTTNVPEVTFVHTSPDFDRSFYEEKVTSIKVSVREMLKRADKAIRISTRQMDMFTDELIALKRRNPDIEITVLTRGPSGSEGDRKRVAGRAFERMKEASIKMPIERDLLHARMVIIDDKEVLVSSADLDYTQMDLEFNAGIWTNNPSVVAEAICYFDNLLTFYQGN